MNLLMINLSIHPCSVNFQTFKFQNIFFVFKMKQNKQKNFKTSLH